MLGNFNVMNGKDSTFGTATVVFNGLVPNTLYNGVVATIVGLKEKAPNNLCKIVPSSPS